MNAPVGHVRKAPRAPRPEDRRIADFVTYDPLTGVFLWKVTRGPHIQIGKSAGSIWRSPRGEARYVIRFDHRGYQANRVAWLVMTGEWPNHIVDHADGDSLNNRWSNLRKATGEQNAANARPRRDNTAGLKGVSQKGSRFVARIQSGKRRLSLGSFETAEEAYAAYCRAAAVHHGDFRRTA